MSLKRAHACSCSQTALRHAHLGPCARARKQPAAGSHSIAPAGPEHKGNAGNHVLEAMFRSMAMCSCSQTAARRSWDSALCATPHVLVLAKKVRENANVLALATTLDGARFHAPGLMIQILRGCHRSTVPMLGEHGARFRAPEAPAPRHRCRAMLMIQIPSSFVIRMGRGLTMDPCWSRMHPSWAHPGPLRMHPGS